MSELSAQQRQQFKQRLEERFRQLREEIGQELLNSEDPYYQQLAGTVHDTEEESVADLLLDLNLADIDRHVQEIRQVEVALNRIESGGYGVCTDCGVPIDPSGWKPIRRRHVASSARPCTSNVMPSPGHPSL